MAFDEAYYINIVNTRKLNKDQLLYYKRLARESGMHKLLALIDGAKKPRSEGAAGRTAISQEVVRLGSYFVKKAAAADFGWGNQSDIPIEHRALFNELTPYAAHEDIKILKSEHRESVSLKSRKYGSSIVVAKRYRNEDQYIFHNWSLANLAPAYQQEWADQSIDGILHKQTGPGGQYFAMVYLPDLDTVKKLLSK